MFWNKVEKMKIFVLKDDELHGYIIDYLENEKNKWYID